MDDYLREAFRHNAWATQQLLTVCRQLTNAQLNAPGQGTYGSILETVNHLVDSDPAYLPRIRVDRPDWIHDADNLVGLDILEQRAQHSASLWETYLTGDSILAPDHPISLNDGTYETTAAVPVVQALHHGTLHREQVCSLLTALGVEAPDLQVWAWAEETGRSREVEPAG